ncbi:MAG: transcriptional antiterminator, BglG [Clostridia bacterium]|jgi:transcriptional antiterminator/mannitol/fructose-specific phosphotransferase system IIA component (Ntr-type)|nr:transcriptional antiterminator, BglG [Clostridia bacterium]
MQVIEKRAFNLLQYILSSRSYSLEKAKSKLACTERQISYDLQKINDMLKAKDISPIKLSHSRFLISDETKEAVRILNIPTENFIISGENKIWLCCLMIFTRKEPLGLNHFIVDFKCSKSTILADLKKLGKIAANYRVALSYTRKQGYYFIGSAKNIRTLILYAISSMKDNYLCKEQIALALQDKSYLEKHKKTECIIGEVIKRFNLPVISEYLTQAIYFISILPYHCQALSYQAVSFSEHLWMHLPLYSAATGLHKALDPVIPETEVEYLFILLLSMTLGNEIYFQIYSKESLFLKELSYELANRFEAVTGNCFKDKEKVAKNMLMHLQPAYFRLKYGIPVVNPILDQIKKDYGDMFSICRLVLEPLSDYVDSFIPDDEIGYIAIHFLAMLETYEPDRMRKRAIIVCQNGLASSVMMKNQLTKMFPEILFLDPCNLEEFDYISSESYDIIFSATKDMLDRPNKHVFFISPILTADEKFTLAEEVYSSVFGVKRESITVNTLLNIITDYAQIFDLGGLTDALQKHLIPKYKLERRGGLPVLKDLLTEATIRFADHVSDWEEAIWLGARPLLENGAIEKSYVEAMISNVKTHGPYIVICPLIAIPHAENKVGVLKMGMSFLKLREPVNVLNNPDKEVKLLITLAAVDSKTHLKALAQLSNLLSDTQSREELIACSTTEEVLKMLETVPE